MHQIHVLINPKPLCPVHKEPMVLKTPNPKFDLWPPFWGCPHYRAGCLETAETVRKLPEQLGFWDQPADYKAVWVNDT